MGNIFSFGISCDSFLSSCLDHTVRKANYIREIKHNLDDLQSEIEKLIEARNDVMRRVMVAEEKQMKRLEQVQGWLARAETMGIEVEELIKDSSKEVKKLCFGGHGSKNGMSSYTFGKKVVKMLEAVVTLKSEGDFKDVAERMPKDSVDEVPIQPTIVGLESMFDNVWRCLKDEKMGIVGLCGTGGVGKTTLLTQINNNFCNERHDFKVVIWVTVSENLQLEKIQETIGKKIGLFDQFWKNKKLEEKALDIFKILRKQKFVLLLDDVWDPVDLTKVGVPLPTQKISSKIVFTTRFIEVCGRMEADKYFRVECLNDEEAWKLFRSKLGEDILDGHVLIHEVAKIVAKECGGLPLALITVGRAMACKKTPEEWNYAVQVLRRSICGFPGMNEVYSRLKFSYDNLPSDMIRSCFLYCSIFPQDFKIFKKDLIDYWISEGFLDEHDHRSVAINQGFYIIGILLNACLLEEVDGDHVKMHNVIQHMALWIASKIEMEMNNFLVQTSSRLTELPKVGKWLDVRRISLMENQIENLLETPTCPHLQTLLLYSNHLRMISNDFFRFMPCLKVLDMSCNPSLTKLPPGISKLVSLQHLDLSGTSIEELPKEIEILVNLKYLNLDCTYYLRTVPRQLISNFRMLSVLRMFQCGSLCRSAEDSVLYGGNEFLIEELLHLKNLYLLSIDLGSTYAFQRFFRSHNLQNSALSLCLQRLDKLKQLHASALVHMEHLSRLYILECEDLEEVKIDYLGEVQKILPESHGFQSLRIVYINSCQKLKDLTWLILAPNLGRVTITFCFGLEEIISARKFGEVHGMMRCQIPFAKLKILTLRNLPNLKLIYWKALPFPLLKKISVTECPRLEKLPLDSNSKRTFFIKGEEHWWEKLQWEDQATQNAFLPCFRSWDRL